MADERLNPFAILELTEWADLEDDYGPGFSDTPARLRDLVSGDASAVASSLNHLGNTLLNDGVVYSATAPAFRYVAALLGDQPSRAAITPPWEAGRFPLRGKLLGWLGGVAFDVSFGRERWIRKVGGFSPSTPFPDFLSIRSIYPEAFPSVASHLEDSDPRVVEAALVAAVLLVESPALAEHRGSLAPLVEGILTQSSSRATRWLASAALNAWEQGGASCIYPLLIEEEEDVYDPQETQGPIDEPPF